MPANLPPQYFETEKKLKAATTPEEKINVLEELLSIIPKHKGTEKIQAQLKTKIAKLKSEAKKKPTTAHQGPTHGIKRSGAGQLIFIGLPNSGKSLLIKALTNADPQVSDYPYTTTSAYPAMMKFEDIQIQLIDTPPLSPDYMEIWIPEIIKISDGVLFILDLSTSNSVPLLESIIHKLGENKIGFYPKIPPEDKINHFFYKKAVIVANKNDTANAETNLNLLNDFLKSKFPLISVSAKTGDGLTELKKSIFLMLEIIRVYSKIPGGKTELENPFTLKKGSTVLDMARAVHKDFSLKLKFARIWGKNTYQGQKVKRDHILEDEDIIELHI